MPLQFTASEYFDLPKEKVFEGLTDLDAAKHWMSGYINIEKLKGTRIEPGAEWRETRKMFGRSASEVFEVVSVIPGREIKLRVDGSKGTSKKGEYLFQYLLEEKNGGTDVTLNGEIGGVRGFAAFMGKLFIGSFKKACLKDLRALKAYLEAQKIQQ
ncbi:MAG TPA: SRPBCC family protein [Chitinophagaceae bacterium]|nr:SRPBCC family protein [Chitinophagaceae bacterium]HEX5652022.1 SRPBCC family protein [Chitinophagaceae bacterium]